MEFGEIIEYNKINIFPQKLCQKWTSRLVPDLFLFFKALYEIKAT